MCKLTFKILKPWFLEVYADRVDQVVPDIAALPFANVSVMTWVVGSAGQRQVVSSGDWSCVPIDEWLGASYGGFHGHGGTLKWMVYKGKSH